MKYALAILGVSLLLFSCNKEEQFKKSLVGTWNATTVAENIYDANGGLSESKTTSDYSTFRYTFNEDGTGTYKSVESSGEIEYPITWVYNHTASTLSVSFSIFWEETFVYSVVAHEKNKTLSLSLDHTYYVPSFGLDGEKLVGSYNFAKN